MSKSSPPLKCLSSQIPPSFVLLCRSHPERHGGLRGKVHVVVGNEDIVRLGTSGKLTPVFLRFSHPLPPPSPPPYSSRPISHYFGLSCESSEFPGNTLLTCNWMAVLQEVSPQSCPECLQQYPFHSWLKTNNLTFCVPCLDPLVKFLHNRRRKLSDHR